MKKIKINDIDYPEKLRKIKKPPLSLYAIGNIDLLNKDALAVVGTRHISEYGIENCRNIVREIVKCGIPVISGMAIGTDTVAHNTTLDYGGETIAVLGGGLNKIYPKCNKKLFDRIINNNGLVISEYSENESANSDRFLERNRIVSGLSVGVLVIEAAHRSGTSVTANFAKRQGKVVMALPGRLDEIHGEGVNRLIQNGAKLIIDINDIIENFDQFKINNEYIEQEVQESFLDIKEEYRDIYDLLNKNKKMTLDDISQCIDKNIMEIMSLLMNMEIDNIIKLELGEGYSLVK